MNHTKIYATLTTRTLALLFVLGFALMSCEESDDDTSNRPYTISGDANGAQVVPPVSVTGTGTVTGNYNPQTRVLNYSSTWNGLTGPPTSGGFYSGATGASGTAVGDPWTIATNSTSTGTTAGTITLTEEQARQLLNGGWYYTYGTSANPGGEIRGQVTTAR